MGELFESDGLDAFSLLLAALTMTSNIFYILSFSSTTGIYLQPKDFFVSVFDI